MRLFGHLLLISCLAADAGRQRHYMDDTSLRGSDYAITKSSKIKTNESPSSSVRSLGQRRVLSGYVMTNSNIRTAKDAWLANPTAAESTYGHISTWDVSRVTDMSELFCSLYHSIYRPLCNTAAASFNEDIGAWDTSRVTTMNYMFMQAYDFNQDLSGWAVDKVTDMFRMFYKAYDFDQDLGWCVDDDVDLREAFTSTPCRSTSCGSICAPSPKPTHRPTPRPTPRPISESTSSSSSSSGSSSQKSNEDDVADDDKMMTLVVLAGLLGLSLVAGLLLFALHQQQLAAKESRAPRTSTVTAVEPRAPRKFTVTAVEPRAPHTFKVTAVQPSAPRKFTVTAVQSV